VNVELLQLLKAARGEFIAFEALGESPESVIRDLDEWTRFGYEIERHPYHGAAYRGPAARLCPDLIEWRLGARCVGRRIAVWDRVASTNDIAARAGRSAANEGLVVLAESQTAGRGRRGRFWTAPPCSSVLMSVLLFPERPLDDPGWLTALGAVATAEVAERATQRSAAIKWPNDVRVDGRKVAGVLVERGSASILGIGVNVNTQAHEFPDEIRTAAGSLRMARGEPLDRSEIARELVLRIDELYDQGRRLGPGALSLLWRDRLEALGRLVHVHSARGLVEGRLVDADLTAGLLIETAEGSTVGVTHAEIQSLREQR
jgi:BirA family transcriptional regulator, biotin operon repressor / biotin---[acetyl-CoA-carboxylase] ligase